VLDILHNQLFPHVEDLPKARVTFLAECVRKILRVVSKLEQPPSKDDTRYQRLLTSGFLCQMLFQNMYKGFVSQIKNYIDVTYNYNKTIYNNMDFLKIFSEANHHMLFQYGFLTKGVLRGFKGKWETGPNKQESGVLQELSRLSYLDFTSHLRRAVLNFDTSMKLTGPRMLHATQYGYFCAVETPSGSHIGITKNLSIMTAISTNSPTDELVKWLYNRANVLPCEFVTPELAAVMVPVYLNSGIVGYTGNPNILGRVLRLMKRSGH
jgi:DNA-directed RNA polymerase beta subunit